MDNAPPLVSDLVLIGGGHAHVHVLKMLGMPKGRETVWQEGIRVTLIARDIHTPYSGMLPGFVAGHYSLEQIHLDLAKLCRFANVRLVHGSATKIDYDSKQVHCDDGRPPLRFDALSIDIGSAPSGTPPKHVTPVKPIAHFAATYQALQERLEQQCLQYNKKSNPFCLAVVGGGAGGIELALAVHHNLRNVVQKQGVDPDAVQVTLVTRGEDILPTHSNGVRKIFRRILRERGVLVRTRAEVLDVGTEKEGRYPKKLLFVASSRTNNGDSGTVGKTEQENHLLQQTGSSSIRFDECLWCTHAGASSWMNDNTPFATTDDGFLKINDAYELVHHPGVFAAGDCCHNVKHPRPKAGVFAVRAGPPLVDNLLRYLTGKPLKPHKPQKNFLSLISTGDTYAIASRADWFALEGKWLWKMKDNIDRTWMDKYTTDLPDLEDMMSKMNFRRNKSTGRNKSGTVAAIQALHKGPDVLQAFAADPMRCGGCGAKVGATTVSRVLQAVYDRQLRRAQRYPDLLSPPKPIDHDDAAIVPVPKPGSMINTIDYFRSFIGDPFVFGKIAAVHALSDVHAMGASAQTALALAVVPFAADESITESTLLDLLSGVSDVLQDEGVSIVGGHTCEGTELACGLAVQGFTESPDKLLRKSGGQPGDKIVLTKPLGTGALFAADMRAKCKGSHVVEAIKSMSVSNYKASMIAAAAEGVHACTDVTGFGLMGHLLEMLLASNDLDATLNLKDIPFLRGGLEASKQDILSSLQPQNSRNRRAVYNHREAATELEYPLLFDPQTAGGLMFFVEPSACHQFVEELRQHYPSTTVIGELSEHDGPKGQNADGVCTIGSGSATSGFRVRVIC